MNYLSWAAAAYRTGGGLDAPLFTSAGADLTVTSLLLPLVCGSAVVISRQGGAEGLAGLLAQGRRFGLVKVVPGHLPLLAALVPARQLAAAARVLVAGGEALAGADARGWLETAPGSVLVNEYGPTETVVGCSAFQVRAGRAGPRPAGPDRDPGQQHPAAACWTGSCVSVADGQGPESCTAPRVRGWHAVTSGGPGVHRRAVRRLPVQALQGNGCTAAVTWRSCTPTAGWIRRARRREGQDPRLPGRARRDRGRPANRTPTWPGRWSSPARTPPATSS